MKNWQMRPLGELCLIERGGSPRPIDKYITDDPNGINWIKIGDTTESMYITQTKEKIIPEGMKKSRYVQKGDFLLSNSMSFGRPYILDIDGCIHDGWLVIRDNNGLFDKRFLYYFLGSPVTYQKFKSMAVGGVVNNLNIDMVKKVLVPVLSMEEQVEIADILDKVTTLIKYRKNQLTNLDNLVKSRFIELFGKYESTSHTTIDAISDMVTVGIANSATHAYSDQGTIMFRNQNIKEDHLDDSDLIYITADFAKKYKTKELRENDILVTRTGYPGIACLVPKKYEGCQTFTTLIVRLKESKAIIPRYVCCYINSSYGKNFVDGMKVGVAQQNFGAKAMAQMPIFIPPLSEQQSYIDFVEQTDKLKLAVQEALAELETLKKSLMQQYFG